MNTIYFKANHQSLIVSLNSEWTQILSLHNLERHVYRKGADSVRKFLLAKRGGEDALPYIVTYTDFSAGRKEPLKISTDYAYTEERAKGLLETLHTANVKKGW